MAAAWLLAAAAEPVKDPFNSSQWGYLHERLLGGEPVVFDDRVRVLAPDRAEDASAVPVLADASAVPGVTRLRVFADTNPLPLILDFIPHGVAPRVGFQFKIEQATVLRVAARTPDGRWHVGGHWVDAVGGGCTLPAADGAGGDWADTLGYTATKVWALPDARRVRFQVMHPMDTGLVAGVPAFYLERLALHDGGGAPLAELKLYEPVSANPVFTVDLPPGAGGVTLEGSDNNGNRVSARIGP